MAQPVLCHHVRQVLLYRLLPDYVLKKHSVRRFIYDDTYFSGTQRNTRSELRNGKPFS
jgi:hypothetical protein